MRAPWFDYQQRICHALCLWVGFLKPKISCKNIVLFAWRCDVLTMFQKIAKHSANDASNDVHRPPLPGNSRGGSLGPLRKTAQSKICSQFYKCSVYNVDLEAKMRKKELKYDFINTLGAKKDSGWYFWDFLQNWWNASFWRSSLAAWGQDAKLNGMKFGWL